MHLLVAAAIALLAAGPVGLGDGPVAEAKEAARAKNKNKKTTQVACRLQSPQKFLKRRTFVQKGMLNPKKHAKAVREWRERHSPPPRRR